MRFFIVACRDVRADVFMNLVLAQSLGGAERQFADEINRPASDNVMYQHPEDFELYHMGFFDATTGRVEVLAERVQLAAGSSVVRQVPGDKRQLPLTGVPNV